MSTFRLWAACVAIGLFGWADQSAADEKAEGSVTEESQSRQYTFAWKFMPETALAPRGGTTRGTPITVVSKPSAEWQALQEPDLPAKERDRRAILAMAGPYRASFDFLETMGFAEDYSPPAPYQSWGTEYVYVVADDPDFISLQHVLVMFMVMPDGQVSDAIVVKHWRQDWQYQARSLHVYTGFNRWQSKRLSRREAQGTWVQSVYQVDDSPRYAAQGRWQHSANFSSWESAETWRPLPRREFSVRDDYQTLIGTNRHTITPTGWIHTEDNRKVVLDEAGGIQQTLAVEAGLNRYERIADHDWSAGDRYWSETGPFWQEVRAAWRDLFANQREISLHSTVDRQTMFQAMFGLARKHKTDPKMTGFQVDLVRADIASTLDRFRR
ncbi:MAG: DUF6607 family protein [Pseudomonadota bacterium]